MPLPSMCLSQFGHRNDLWLRLILIMSVYLYLGMTCECRCMWRPEEGVQFPGAGVRGCCQPLNLGECS